MRLPIRFDSLQAEVSPVRGCPPLDNMLSCHAVGREVWAVEVGPSLKCVYPPPAGCGRCLDSRARPTAL